MTHLTLSDSNFEKEVLKSDKPVLVDFWATWCPPCRALGPIIEELASEYLHKAKVGKLDVDQSQQLAEKYGIMSLPTVIVFKDGNPLKSLVGVQPKEKYEKAINEVISS